MRNFVIKIVSGIIGVSAICGLGAVVSHTETTTEIVVETIQYQTKTEYDNSQREGVKTTKQEGQNGSKTVTYEITKNYLGNETSRKAVDTKINKSVQDQIVVVGTKKYYTCSNGTEYDNKADKDECDKRVAWEKGREQALRECNADSSKTNCWYDEYPGTYIHWTEPRTYTYTPAPGPSSGYRNGAICRDGWRSSATGRGACSHHGGVAYWI